MMQSLLTLGPVQSVLTDASGAARLEAEEAGGYLLSRCDYVHKQLEKEIEEFLLVNSDDSGHTTLMHSWT